MYHRKNLTSLLIKFYILVSVFVSYTQLNADIVNDPESVGWASRRNLTSGEFADEFAKRKENGYILVDIEVNQIEGKQRVSGIWQRNHDDREWAEYRLSLIHI